MKGTFFYVCYDDNGDFPFFSLKSATSVFFPPANVCIKIQIG